MDRSLLPPARGGWVVPEFEVSAASNHFLLLGTPIQIKRIHRGLRHALHQRKQHHQGCSPWFFNTHTNHHLRVHIMTIPTPTSQELTNRSIELKIARLKQAFEVIAACVEREARANTHAERRQQYIAESCLPYEPRG